MRFNVGDKVILKDTLVSGQRYGAVLLYGKMHAILKGKVNTITGVNPDDNTYIIDIWKVSDEMVEKVE